MSRAPWRLDILAEADTIIVPGLGDPLTATPPAVLKALRDNASRGARIASICVGAFVLAQAGLLNGRRATTDWAAATDLARLYPDIDVDPDVLFVENGSILTSAGAAAGLDLCLHLVRRDFGSAVAADTARATVMSLERGGGQAQFINHLPPRPDSDTLGPTLSWLEENCNRPLTLADIATHAAMSNRTVSRRFQDHLGTSPMRWLTNVRIRRAQQLLEATDEPIETIADLAGFGSANTLRDHFVDIVGTKPTAYRRSFNGSHSSGLANGRSTPADPGLP